MDAQPIIEAEQTTLDDWPMQRGRPELKLRSVASRRITTRSPRISNGCDRDPPPRATAQVIARQPMPTYGPAAILAADVAGYSRLMGKDEEGTLERLKALRRELAIPRSTAATRKKRKAARDDRTLR